MVGSLPRQSLSVGRLSCGWAGGGGLSRKCSGRYFVLPVVAEVAFVFPLLLRPVEGEKRFLGVVSCSSGCLLRAVCRSDVVDVPGDLPSAKAPL